MKLAVTGKGGVGKTTISALLALALAGKGHRVLAVDADPNATLGHCLGFPDPNGIVPISEMADLIEERTGAKPGAQGSMFKLNPRVEDIPERFAARHGGIRLLRMGAVKTGGAGCYCPENALLKSLASHLFLHDRDALIMDMEAGVEHLTRGTARGVDWLLTIVEPSRQSVETARRIRSLANDIGIERFAVIGNKSRSEEESEFITESVAPTPVLGIIPYDDALRLSELNGCSPKSSLPAVEQAINDIVDRLCRERIT